MINRFGESKPFIVKDLEAGSDNLITFVFEQNSFHYLLLFAFVRVISGHLLKKTKTPSGLRQAEGGTRMLSICARALRIIVVNSQNGVHSENQTGHDITGNPDIKATHVVLGRGAVRMFL